MQDLVREWQRELHQGQKKELERGRDFEVGELQSGRACPVAITATSEDKEGP